jgi:hypothetical protein
MAALCTDKAWDNFSNVSLFVTFDKFYYNNWNIVVYEVLHLTSSKAT